MIREYFYRIRIQFHVFMGSVATDLYIPILAIHKAILSLYGKFTNYHYTKARKLLDEIRNDKK